MAWAATRRLVVLCVLVASAWGQHTEVTIEDNQTVTGNKTLIGNNTLTAGQNSINFFQHNNQVWAGTGASSKYTTLEGALGATECPSGNCEINLQTGFSENPFTSTITAGGNQTNWINIEGFPTAQLTSNVSGGNASLLLNSQTGLVGHALGSVTNSTGGFQLSLQSTANTSCLLCIGNPTQSGGNSYIRAENLMLQGNTSATVTSAMVDIAAVNNMGSFHNIDVLGNYANTIGIRVRSTAATGGVAGPLNLDNLWANGSYQTGQRPCVLESTSGNTILGINWIGGICNHPASAGTMLEVNGHGTTSVSGVNILGTYLENLQNGSGIGFKIADARAVHISGLATSIRDTDTEIDISQSASHLTGGVNLISVVPGSPTNSATTVNNHITGAKFPSSGGWSVLPFYSYGGDVGMSVMPFTIESNNFEIWDSANHRVVSIPAQSSTGVQATISNAADAQGFTQMNCGLTADQFCGWAVGNHSGTIQWVTGWDGSGNYIVSDRVNVKTRLLIAEGANAVIGQVGFVPESTGTQAALSGTGACATITTQSGGSFAGSAKCTGTTGASTLTITLPTAVNGYVCNVQDETTRANLFQQTSHTQTTCVLTITSVTQNDVFVFTAFAF